MKEEKLRLTWRLIHAADSGDVLEVERLIPLSDPLHMDSEALKCASERGHLRCVELLIPVSDPKSDDSEALTLAIGHNFCDIVKLLIPVSELKVRRHLTPLQYASFWGNKECVDLLYPHSDVVVDLYDLKSQHPNESKRWEYLEYKFNKEQKDKINKELMMSEEVIKYKKRKM